MKFSRHQDSELVLVRASTGDVLLRDPHLLGTMIGLRVFSGDRFLACGLRGLECRSLATGDVLWRQPLGESGLLTFAESAERGVVVGITPDASFLGWHLSDGKRLVRLPEPLAGVPRAVIAFARWHPIVHRDAQWHVATLGVPQRRP